MKHLRFFFKYLHYLLTAKTKHAIHSPFVFELLSNIIEDTTPFYKYSLIESCRARLLLSHQTITVKDFGAGINKAEAYQREVKSIAKHSAKSAKYGQLLFRMVNHFHPKNILELGTSLGISTMYQLAPNSKAKVITLEGCPETANIAKQNFELLGFKNIESMVGNFENTLPQALQKLEKVDYVFFDGNHRKTPTLAYFEQCLNYAHNETLFIFDDIHWSKEMEEAWTIIKNNEKVTVTIDLFFLGLVFFRKEQLKQHFVLRF